MGDRARNEQGRFIAPDDVVRYRTIDVWDMREGDILKSLRDASWRDLQRLEEQYDEPWHSIQVEELE